jgi:HmuY protein
MMSKYFLSLFLITALMLSFSSCSNNEVTNPGNGDTASTTRADSDNYWITKLDASSEDQYVYYSFERKDTIQLTDTEAQSSTEWDIAFERAIIVTNSGVSGPGDALGVNLTELGDATSFVAVTSDNLNNIQQNQWLADGQSLIIDDYYIYNPTTHALDMTHYIYAMKDADGHYMKIQFLEIYGGGAPPAMGTYVIKYVYQPNPSAFDLTGPVVVDTIDGSTGVFYYDFSSGSEATPTDPPNSTDWDIKVESYDVYLNSAFSGIGDAAANQVHEMYSAMTDSTDFDYYSTATPIPQAYRQDSEGSIFADWYNYNSDTHVLTTKANTYVVKCDTKTYKLTIETWYGDTGESANFIFHWEEL